MLEIKLNLDVENSRSGKVGEEHMAAVMLTRLSGKEHFMTSRCYNYCTWKAGRGRQ